MTSSPVAARPDDSQDQDHERGVAGSRLIYFLGLLLVLLVGGFSRGGDWLSRPLGQDELITLNWTGGAYQPHIEDLREIPPLGLRQFVTGVGRMFANDWDPNNQLVNTFLVNLSGFLLGYSEWTIRLPAFLGFLAAAGLLYHLCRRLSGSVWISLALALLFVSNPQVFRYSVMARGFIFLLLLGLLQIWLVQEKAFYKRWWGITAIWAVAFLHLLQVLNLPSSALLWVAPFCLALFCTPPAHLWQAPVFQSAAPGRAPFRLFWVICCTTPFFASSLFVLVRLPDFLRAQSKYGFTLESWADLQDFLGELLARITPGTQLVVPVFAAGFLIYLFARKRAGWLGWLTLVSMALAISYSAATGKAFWERNYNYLFLLALLHIAQGGGLLLADWRRSDRARTAGLAEMAGAATLVIAALLHLPVSGRSLVDYASGYNWFYAKYIYENNENLVKDGVDVLILDPWIWDTTFYTARDPHFYTIATDTLADAGEPQPLDILLVTRQSREDEAADNPREGFRTVYWDRDYDEFLYWQPSPGMATVEAEENHRRLLRLRSKLQELPPNAPVPTGTNVYFWVSPPTAQITPYDAIDTIARLQKNHANLRVSAQRYPEKSLRVLVAVFPGDMVSNSAQWQALRHLQDTQAGTIYRAALE